MRDRALFDLAIDSKLRGCDLVKMKIGSLVTGAEIRTRSMVIQQKTGRPVQFEITADVRASLQAWLQRRGGTVDDYAFPSRIDHNAHLSTRQYARLVDEWVTAIGLRSKDYGTLSLRRTKAAMIYKATGNLRAIQILLGHTKIENTVRYLGVDIEDALDWRNIPRSESVRPRAQRGRTRQLRRAHPALTLAISTGPAAQLGFLPADDAGMIGSWIHMTATRSPPGWPRPPCWGFETRPR